MTLDRPARSHPSGSTAQALPSGSFFGHAGRAWRFERFLLAERRYAARGALPRHAHQRPHLCVVLEGEYEETLPGRNVHRRRPGDVLFLPADCAHEERHGGAGRHLMIELTERCADELDLPREPVVLQGGGSAAASGRLAQEIWARREPSRWALEGLALELVALLEPRGPGRLPPRWLAAVEDRLAHPPWSLPSLAVLAAEAGVHPAHLARAFRRHTGHSVHEFARGVRLDSVRRALVETDRPIALLALDFGFNDQSHLTRHFRARFGITPARLRRAADARRS